LSAELHAAVVAVDVQPIELNQDTPALAEALRVHGLAWR
jgi:hypothetical protein